MKCKNNYNRLTNSVKCLYCIEKVIVNTDSTDYATKRRYNIIILNHFTSQYKVIPFNFISKQEAEEALNYSTLRTNHSLMQYQQSKRLIKNVPYIKARSERHKTNY